MSAIPSPVITIPPSLSTPPILSPDVSSVASRNWAPNIVELGRGVDELGHYQHPQGGPNEFWYNCAIRKSIVYLWFDATLIRRSDINAAMRYALDNGVDGVTVRTITMPGGGRKLEFATRAARPLEDGAFNADYKTVDFTDLTTIFSITHNVHVVMFQGAKYIHKSTFRGSSQSSFEKEFDHYVKYQRCQGLPSLAAVVKREGMIRGLLLSYIDGENLGAAAIKSESLLLDITYRIIAIAAGLEEVGCYHYDLKCANIIRRRSDGAIYFIDFGPGATEGFFPEEAEDDIFFGRPNPPAGIYILGKTLWQLWTDAAGIPGKELPDSIPEPAHSIIYDCCVGRKFNSIAELQKVSCPAR